MKKLTNMKLINWHRFINTNFNDFGKVNLLTGENGSGKTTILDAIQYVLLASSNSFNSAAHLNGKRKVTTYVRSKTGKENETYERKGSITSHIALEFYEEQSDTYFVLGAVIDSQSETQERTIRYLIEGKQLSEIEFIKNQVPLSIKDFKAANKIDSSNFFSTAKSAKTAIANRLGRLENRFFELIPKSIAFKPIDDIKDFVFTYVLDEKSVDIDELQDIVLSYTDLENILLNAQIRLSELEEIIQLYQEVQKYTELEQKYKYYICKAQNDQSQSQIKRLKNEIEILKNQILENKELSQRNEQEKLQCTKLIDDLKAEMNNNETFLALENVKIKLQELQIEYKSVRELIEELKKNGDASKKLLKLLKHRGYINENFDELEKVCQNLVQIDNPSQIKNLIKLVIEIKEEEKEKLHFKQYQVSHNCSQLTEEIDKVQKEINLLQHNQRSYPKNTTKLFNKVKDVFRENNTGSEPHILCEVLEIEDEQWRNAIEGYLNTQRFYIIVDPEDYDLALSVYEKLRKQKKAYGVGLINAANLIAYDSPVKNSLATVISSKNIYAKRYLNWLLRNVVLCENVNDLKNHKAGITKGCMKYQNRVVSAIKPSIYEIPWIGERSYAMQLKRAIKKKEELEAERKPLEEELNNINRDLELIGTKPDEYLLHHLDDLTRLKNLRLEIEKCQNRIQELEKDKTIVEKQNQLRQLQDEYKTLDSESRKLLRNEGRLEEREKKLEDDLKTTERNYKIIQSQLQSIENTCSMIRTWEKDYKKSLKSKTYDVFIKNFNVMVTRAINQKDKSQIQLLQNMENYNRAHNFGAPPKLESFTEYERMYTQLKSTEILEYEEKVQKAKEKAEEEFKEQFISRLQENIKQAQFEFKQLNLALKDIEFNGERYHFTCKPSRDKRNYYDMIMDPNTIGISIFAGSFFDKHKEEIEELFNQLTQTEDESQLEELMDYRNYLDFDIQITHEDGSFSMYSKVCEEKSGGETQTPFYVAIAASFVQLYKNSISDDTAGLIMFDEAFNNMDDERIAGVLSFIRKLPLQVLIAAPTDRTQYIIPYTDQTIAVYSQGKRNYIAEYSNLNLEYDEKSKETKLMLN